MAVRQEDRKFLQFIWVGKVFKFQCLLVDVESWTIQLLAEWEFHKNVFESDAERMPMQCGSPYNMPKLHSPLVLSVGGEVNNPPHSTGLESQPWYPALYSLLMNYSTPLYYQ